MKIIGICGKKRHGKDTFANTLKEFLEAQGKKVNIRSFAYPLKELVIPMVANEEHFLFHGLVEIDNILKMDHRLMEIDGINKIIITLQSFLKDKNYSLLSYDERSNIEANILRPKNELYRFLLQYVGTDIIRKRNKNHWVDEMKKYIDNIKDDYDFLIIPDVRFLNEQELIKSHDGIIVKIVRKSLISKDNDKHISETEVDSIKYDYYYEIDEGIDNINKVVGLFILQSNIINVDEIFEKIFDK